MFEVAVMNLSVVWRLDAPIGQAVEGEEEKRRDARHCLQGFLLDLPRVRQPRGQRPVERVIIGEQHFGISDKREPRIL